jgi:ABC-type nitrate/sulfonate/bicarbonate transport system substrate-binding protein
MNKKTGLVIFLLISLTLLTLTACSKQDSKKEAVKAPLTKVSVMLDWTPNTNHSGLYAALEKGYYKEQGLDVEILQAGETGTDQLVAAGKVDFGVSYQEGVTNARAANIPLVSLAAVIQHNTSGFASLKSANITRPRDMESKKYGGWGSPAEHAVIDAIVTKDGGDPKKIEFIDIGSADFFSVIGKQVDFYWIFQGWDGIQANLKKVPINTIMLKDYDPALDYYTPVIVTNEKHIAEKPDIVKKFMTATSKGYNFCIKNPDEAASILLKYTPELDPKLVKASQKWLSSQYTADAPYWGRQDKVVWDRYAKWMFERKLLSKEIDVNKAFSNDFLPEK